MIMDILSKIVPNIEICLPIQVLKISTMVKYTTVSDNLLYFSKVLLQKLLTLTRVLDGISVNVSLWRHVLLLLRTVSLCHDLSAFQGLPFKIVPAFFIFINLAALSFTF